LTRPNFLKHSNHAAATRPAIHIYGQWRSFWKLSGLDEPEERVDGVVALAWAQYVRWQANISSILFLRRKDSRTGADRRALITDCDVAINGRSKNSHAIA
jgi:hypothetical protein